MNVSPLSECFCNRLQWLLPEYLPGFQFLGESLPFTPVITSPAPSPEGRKLKVCVARPSREYSETFIDNHIAHLPAEVVTAWDGFIPRRFGQGTAIMRLHERISDRLANRIEKLRPWGRHIRARAFTRFLRKQQIDVLLAEYGPTGVELMDAAERAGVPLVVHFHGYDAQRRDTLEKFGSAYPRLFGKAAGIVAVSHVMAAQLENLGAPRAKMPVIHYGVDTTLFKGAAPGDQPPHFLAVGRFVEKKAPQLLILAFAEVHRALPESRLTLAGSGHLVSACRQLVRALGLEDAVDLPGAIDHREIGERMRRSRAFVQHSVTAPDGDAEGTPVAILEALCSGLPVVATRHGGISETVVDRRTGFLVDEFDLKTMADRMLALGSDANLASAMGRMAREHAVRAFSLERSIARLMEVIEAAAGNRALRLEDEAPQARLPEEVAPLSAGH